jgi:hypothetical protein
MFTVSIPSADSTTAKPPRPGRWVPLSLRLFVMALALAFVGNIVSFSLHASRERAAVREIERLGGVVRLRKLAPHWLRSLLGTEINEFLSEAYEAGLGDAELADTDLRHLADLTELESVAISETQTTDAALIHIAGLTRVERIMIWEPRLTDDGLVQLSRLKRLKEIDIESSRITDTGLEHLKHFPQLTKLRLRGTKATPAGIEGMKQVYPDLDILVLGPGN